MKWTLGFFNFNVNFKPWLSKTAFLNIRLRNGEMNLKAEEIINMNKSELLNLANAIGLNTIEKQHKLYVSVWEFLKIRPKNIKLGNFILNNGYLQLTIRELKWILLNYFIEWERENCKPKHKQFKIRSLEHPPCIQYILSQKEPSHFARFTLASYLLKRNYPIEKIVEFFKNFNDFDSKLTIYQLKHINGECGRKEKYAFPSCERIKTFGLCFRNEFCGSNLLDYKGGKNGKI